MQPRWFEGALPEGSYRSLFKWGDAHEYKHPNDRLYSFIKTSFGMSDADFLQPKEMGLELISGEWPVKITSTQLDHLRHLVGKENLSTDGFRRIAAAFGKSTIDSIRLRKHVIENIPDALIAPRDVRDVEAIVEYCVKEHIPVYVRGGGSSVTRGFEAVKGGITLDLSTHLNQVVSFNEVNQTITVQAGMSGPQLEDLLNHAPERLGAKRRYTCGHFPQSFEYSTVGGWVVTKGAGQNSTYYGKIEDIVAAQEYVTPTGTIKTQDFPRSATGPDFNQLFMGSEGAFGVLVNVTLRVFRHLPDNRRYFAYMFKDWESAKTSVREIMQSECGFPSVFRLSDAEETDVALKLYGVEGTLADTVLNRLGYHPNQRCLLIGTCDGEGGFTANLQRKINTICREQHAFGLTPFRVTQRWEKERWRDPYLREDLQDYGIIMDTLECAVTWSGLESVHSGVRAYLKSRPQTICMTHLSHAYPQGANLYFIFIARISEIKEYLEVQYGVLDAIQKCGAAMSHHHGLGKQTTPWLEEQAGKAYMDTIRSLKEHFDPAYIMNPGGTLGLDMSTDQAQKRWGLKD
jgi:alkyldihydroxyacetonephosphate synthase